MEQTSLCDKCGVAWPTKQLIVSVKNGESFNLFCPKCAIKKTTKKFENDGGYIKLIRSSEIDFELSFNLEDEMEFLLTGLGLEHKVELVETYSDGYGTYYVLCVSYIENGVLETYNIPVWA